MKRLRFSLPGSREKVRITGIPTDSPWDYDKSGQELYRALQEFPEGVRESLGIEIIAHYFYDGCTLKQLREIEQMKLPSSNSVQALTNVFSSRAKERGIEEALKRKEEKEDEVLGQMRLRD